VPDGLGQRTTSCYSIGVPKGRLCTCPPHGICDTIVVVVVVVVVVVIVVVVDCVRVQLTASDTQS